ncbi:MAG: hypothetical protein ACXWIW_07475 [Croceibacterium sp.]
MKTLTLVLGSAALAVAASPTSAKSSISEMGDAQLARMLDGRVAGAPVKCISTISARRDALQVIDGVGLVFNAGKTIYVSRAADPDKLRWTYVQTIDQLRQTRLCSSDRIWMHDRHNGTFTGVVALTDFVPYTREG